MFRNEGEIPDQVGNDGLKAVGNDGKAVGQDGVSLLAPTGNLNSFQVLAGSSSGDGRRRGKPQGPSYQ